ncbi:hypothetical protein FQA39_LY07652 [Lamprigera yunnana]|nr:hypothetical protein FQA39_LY07652 [Lamprigera yunnana]
MKCKVLGVRSAFDTGCTLSGDVNSVHVAITCTVYLCNLQEGSTEFKAENLITRFYEDDACAVMGVLRNNPYFMCISLNKDSSSIVPPNANYAPHNNGMPLLNKYIDRFHVMSHVGEEILNYNYKFHYVPITYPPCVDLCNGNKVELDDNDIPNLFSRTVTQANDGLVQMSKTQTAFNITWTSGIARAYSQPLEQYYVLHANKHSNIIQEQPKAYIGMFAIPKLNPALQSTDFQNSYIYYDVMFNINVATHHDSIYASGPIHYPPDELTAVRVKNLNNTGGPILCGYFDDGVA